ncbi:DUF3768 domain-containing protein [Paenochrobactrum pullorum]|uniref:DUF3768 domain-containing protein n=1 Tax=Paenochrobactrum pullorum TaxID=1324351 RepID=UPI0035BC2CE3
MNLLPETDANNVALIIAKQNDKFRARLQMPVFDAEGIRGLHVVTRGFASLPPVAQIEICALIRAQSDFTPDNDPYGERDFGCIKHAGSTVLWKIDYYADETCDYGSDTPHDLGQCYRVMTVMLAHER